MGQWELIDPDPPFNRAIQASDHSSSSIRFVDLDPLDPTTAAHPPAAPELEG